MSQSEQDEADKTHEPTPKKLEKAREKGEIARAADVSVAASYGGLLMTVWIAGATITVSLGAVLMGLIERSEPLSELLVAGPGLPLVGQLLTSLSGGLLALFLPPGLAVLLVILAQRAFLVTPSKLQPKFSRVSLLSNARNKFGRSGLFEFAKSFAKLCLYSIGMTLFIWNRLPEIVLSARTTPEMAAALMGRMCLEFLVVVFLISAAIGGVDAIWQHAEHRRKNRMSRKELLDETKDAEGDPYMKQERRMRGQEIATQRMLSDVPSSDVVIVNPTHFSVALKWSRLPGAAPVCVAKGVDEMALTIRRCAQEAGVPIHSDPPTARTLHATVEIGAQIDPDQYMAVAAAIRFAEKMRERAKGAVH